MNRAAALALLAVVLLGALAPLPASAAPLAPHPNAPTPPAPCPTTAGGTPP